MSALADIFAVIRLQLDGTGFEAQATALADKSGRNVGERMSQQLNAKLKSAIGAGVGAAAGFAFGAIVTGANELDAATRQLQADTGMTADEARDAEHALAGMFKNNLQGFEEIGAVMAVVHNELGLTGDAANTASEKFLKFGEATGQNAAAAASNFAQILHAFNLDASMTPAIMDKLIASHQVYGTVITDNEEALAKMAPALQAMNMGVDDGIALLNLFKAAGIDAAKAPQALARAISQLKPGQNINDLIAQISAIEDPTLRAQEAIRIFGVKGGVQLAQAFQPGIVSLQQFATTAQQNADATDNAAQAIEDGFGNKFRLIMKNAAGTLADFGTSFNDLIGLAGLFGPAFTRAITTGVGALVGWFGAKFLATVIPSAIAAATVQGTVMGETTATVATAVEGTELAAGQAAVAAEVTPAATVAGGSIGTALGGAIAGAAALAIPALIGGAIVALAVAAQKLNPLNPQLGPNWPFGDPKHVFDRWAGEASSEATVQGRNVGVAYGGAVLTATEAEMAALPPAMREALEEATAAADKPEPTLAELARAAWLAATKIKAAGAYAGTMWDWLIQRTNSLMSNFQQVGNEVADAIYGPQLDRIRLLDLQRQRSAEWAILNSKKSTDAEKRDAREALVSIGHDVLAQELKMAQAGELSTKQMGDLRAELERDLKKSTGAEALMIQSVIDWLDKLNKKAAMTNTIVGGFVPRNVGGGVLKEATGGYIPPRPGGTLALMAEAGQGEYAVPESQVPAFVSAFGGGGSVTFGDIHLHGVGSDVSLAAARRHAQQVMDIVAIGLRAQGARRRQTSASTP